VSLELHAGVVDVWTVDLDLDTGDPAVLSAEEIARSERFRDPRDGGRWRRARTALRSLLADYVGGSPRALVLDTASRGKPFLADPASDVGFNVSHAGAVALLAFARGAEVGVDVEARSRRFDVLVLARHAFGEAYAEALRDVPADRREDEFLQAWARHEATVKCVGTGLGASALDTAGIVVTDLDVRPDVVAALATRPGCRSIRHREYAAAAQSR
jgi:4'-phosphopantetheinyl transferase